MIDLQSLNYEQFEYLIGRLLVADGYKLKTDGIDKKANAATPFSGPDLILEDQHGQHVVVEIKHFRQQNRLPKALIQRFLDDMKRYLELNSASRAILVCSSELNPKFILEFSSLENISILDRSWIDLAASRHPNIFREFEALVELQKTIAGPLAKTLEYGRRLVGGLENPLIAELSAIPPGKAAWKQYELTGTKVLSHLFVGSLAPPQLQSRSDDGLDIVDAIFPIRAGNNNWERLRAECKTRFMVSEFKNYQESPGQREVESLQQYLFAKAMRTFGVLCSRKEPSPSAIAQRRRAWVEQEKLIVFLTDEDLKEMLRYKDGNGDPFDVIDAQLERFFLTLSP